MKHLPWLPALLFLSVLACSGAPAATQAHAAAAAPAARCSDVDTSQLDFEHQDLLRYECPAP